MNIIRKLNSFGAETKKAPKTFSPVCRSRQEQTGADKMITKTNTFLVSVNWLLAWIENKSCTNLWHFGFKKTNKSINHAQTDTSVLLEKREIVLSPQEGGAFSVGHLTADDQLLVLPDPGSALLTNSFNEELLFKRVGNKSINVDTL